MLGCAAVFPADDIASGILFAVFYVLPYGLLILLAVAYFLQERAVKWTWLPGLQRVGRQLALTLSERVGRTELEPFRGFILLRFGTECYYAAGCSLKGQVNGVAVWLFVLDYKSVFPDRNGRYLGHRAIQTVVILPGRGPLPSFRLGPAKSGWEEVMPAWPVLLDVGELVLTLGEEGQSSQIYGKDREAIRRLFSPRRLALLGDLSGSVVECQDGNLLLYRPGEVIVPDRVPAFLYRAVEIARVLTRSDDEIEHFSGDRDVEPFRNVQEPPSRFTGEA
jgi:hypothetical protein